MMMAYLRAPQAAEEALGLVRLNAIAEAAGFLVVDPVHRGPAMKLATRPASSALTVVPAACRDFGGKHAGKGLAVPFADHNDDLELAEFWICRQLGTMRATRNLPTLNSVIEKGRVPWRCGARLAATVRQG
jgi:hypothetical protein